ncbi:hypothetical protein ACWA2B_09910 [Paenibacillus sp. CMM36]
MKFNVISPDEIPFDKLDIEMREIISLLNCEYGIKTESCCFGHREKDSLYIAFHEDMNDFIEELAIEVATYMKGSDFTFEYWVRKGSKKIKRNWFCRTNGTKYKSDRYRILEEFMSILNNFYN